MDDDFWGMYVCMYELMKTIRSELYVCMYKCIYDICMYVFMLIGQEQAIRVLRVHPVGLRVHHPAHHIHQGIHIRPGRHRRRGHPGRQVRQLLTTE